MMIGKNVSMQLRKYVLIKCVTTLSVVVIASMAWGHERLKGANPTMDPRPLSMGGTLRAAPSGPGGIYLNPATLAMAPLYHIEGMYQYTGGDDKHMGGLAVADSVTTVIAAGAAFNFSGIDQKPNTQHKVYDGRLALAGAIGNSFFIGMTGRYLYVENNIDWGTGPGGVAALPSSGDQEVNGFTFDAGVALRLAEIFTIGVVGQNLTNTGSVYAPLQLGTGASLFLANLLLVELDFVFDFTSQQKVNSKVTDGHMEWSTENDPTWELHAGTELLLGGHVPIRIGYMYEPYYDKLNSLTLGLGYVDQRFAVDVAYVQELQRDGELMIAVGIKYFIN